MVKLDAAIAVKLVAKANIATVFISCPQFLKWSVVR